MITVKNLHKSFWSKTIFDWIHLQLSQKTKAGLVGSNWIGKSTLLKIIAWEEDDYQWEIKFDTGSPLIGYMRQQIQWVDEQKTIMDFLKRYVWIDIVESQINELMLQLENEHKMEEYTERYELFERMGGYSFESIAETLLGKLWLWKYGTGTQVDSLSWWEKNKLLLCGALLKWSDILLLDEPTNNLDTNSIQWLVEYIQGTKACCLIISHDRDFLNHVTNKIYEINDISKQVVEYTWNYSFYEQKKEMEYQNQLLAHQRQQEEFDRIEIASRNLKDQASRIMSNTQSKFDGRWDKGTKVAKKLSTTASVIEQRVERMDKIEKPRQKKPMELILDTSSVPYGSIDISNLKYTYPGTWWFTLQVSSFTITPKDKILITWDNGEGKSTCIKLLLWELPSAQGSISTHSSIKIWYFSQEFDNQNKHLTPLTFLESHGDFSFEEINFSLAKLGFLQDDRHKKIELLSPGMKSRLHFALFSLKKYNCLIFDEPTNHVDVETSKQLENAINNFNGMVIVVTHDQKFISKIWFTKRLHFHNWVWKEKPL